MYAIRSYYVSLLGDYRGLADPIVADHSGEIVDATNSELLVVFFV